MLNFKLSIFENLQSASMLHNHNQLIKKLFKESHGI